MDTFFPLVNASCRQNIIAFCFYRMHTYTVVLFWFTITSCNWFKILAFVFIAHEYVCVWGFSVPRCNWFKDKKVLTRNNIQHTFFQVTFTKHLHSKGGHTKMQAHVKFRLSFEITFVIWTVWTLYYKHYSQGINLLGTSNIFHVVQRNDRSFSFIAAFCNHITLHADIIQLDKPLHSQWSSVGFHSHWKFNTTHHLFARVIQPHKPPQMQALMRFYDPCSRVAFVFSYKGVEDTIPRICTFMDCHGYKEFQNIGTPGWLGEQCNYTRHTSS